MAECRVFMFHRNIKKATEVRKEQLIDWGVGEVKGLR
jgi:hypothetical protein